jgi:sulfate adenylyltransferase
MTAITDPAVSPQDSGITGLLVSPDRAAEIKRDAILWPSWDLTPRQLCDLELLANGAFSPLKGFMGEDDWASVCSSMRLADGTLWPIPVTLDVPEDVALSLNRHDRLALRDPEGVVLAVLHVGDVYCPDLQQEAKAVYGTTSTEHVGVAHLLQRSNTWYVGGSLEAVALPLHHDFGSLRMTPADLQAHFRGLGWDKVVAFQTRNPMHRAHQELTRQAAEAVGGGLLIHPVVGMTKPGDVDHYTRVRCYRAVLDAYPPGQAVLSLLPLAMRMAGPREALWHAIIRKNYGCTHLIVGRDHAGPGAMANGTPFYGPYEAQDLLREYEAEVGVTMVPFRMLTYVEGLDTFLPEDEVPEGARALNISGTELRRRLARGEEIPEWFTLPAVAAELRRSHPVRSQQGVTVLFTGLSGSGKSTIANAVLVRLLEAGSRRVSLLDGDLVRKNLSSELGFSKEHRTLNVLRIGYVAAEITQHGGIALCAPIAPYDGVRKEVRAMAEAGGGFVLVHVATSLEECEARDRKGLYAKARAGIIPEFTGISDPYEAPDDAELVIDTAGLSVADAAQMVIDLLEREGYLGSAPTSDGQEA